MSSKRQKLNESTSSNHVTTADDKLNQSSSNNLFQLEEVNGDLFDCSSAASLCHCVSADMAMGKGIARLFKQTFGGVDELKEQNRSVGDVAVLIKEGRFIYYLVTKPKYYNKPSYATLRASLEAMRRHAETNHVQHIAMPKIGCGLDQLQWPRVKQIIGDVFSVADIAVTVYCL